MTLKKKLEEETIAARIPLGEMVVEEYSQRDTLKQSLVDEMVKHWNESAAGCLILNLRDDGSYAIIDGKHRVAAALKKGGIYDLPAMVFVGKTKQEEAELFVLLNTKHAPKPFAVFMSNKDAGKTEELTIAHILQEVGIEISPQSRSAQVPGKTRTRAINPLYDIYRNYGVQHLKTVVGILSTAFKEYPDRGKAFTSPAIYGMSSFIYRYPQASIPRLIEKLKGVSPTTLQGRAFSDRSGYEALYLGWGRTITKVYNAGFSSRSKEYLDITAWDKIKVSPAGRQKMAITSPRNLPRFKGKFVKVTTDPSLVQAAAKTAKDKE